jgi:hypothetical protein
MKHVGSKFKKILNVSILSMKNYSVMKTLLLQNIIIKDFGRKFHHLAKIPKI